MFLSENKINPMYLHFEVLGYFCTTSITLIPQSCPPGFMYSCETKTCVWGSHNVTLISQQLLLHHDHG